MYKNVLKADEKHTKKVVNWIPKPHTKKQKPKGKKIQFKNEKNNDKQNVEDTEKTLYNFKGKIK